MARREIIELLDDLDGSKANETVRFAIDGTLYEIDLSERNASRLRKALGDFVASARRVRAGVTASKGAATPRQTTDKRHREYSKQARAWLDSNRPGVTAGRGRIPAELVAAYEAKDVAMVDRWLASKGRATPEPEPVEEVATVVALAANMSEGGLRTKTGRAPAKKTAGRKATQVPALKAANG